MLEFGRFRKGFGFSAKSIIQAVDFVFKTIAFRNDSQPILSTKSRIPFSERTVSRDTGWGS